MQPGWVDSNRPAPALFLLRASGFSGLLALCLLGACASSGPPDRVLASVWRDYRAMPDQRALAIAGELRHDRWVAGASGGHATPADAKSGALRECARRRMQQRMQAPCRIYAIGDEVVASGS